MSEKTQCELESELGEIISSYARDTQYCTYLEIGTWFGEGTTKCFLDGLLPRNDDWSFYTLEVKLDCYTQATSFWSSLSDDSRVNFLRGTIVDIETIKRYYEFITSRREFFPLMGAHFYSTGSTTTLEIMEQRIPENSELLQLARQFSPQDALEFMWRQELQVIYEADIENCASCDNVEDKLPSSIDVVLLDGGPFSTMTEFLKLMDRTSVFILDDIHTPKTYFVNEALDHNPNWEVIIKNDKDRSGFAVYNKVSNG
jgi:predicted O-methyltransferase YrrM